MPPSLRNTSPMTLHQSLRALFRRVQGYGVNEQEEILARASNQERPRLSAIMTRTIADPDGRIVAEGSSGRLSLIGRIEAGPGVRLPLSAIPVIGTDEHILDALTSRVAGKEPGTAASGIFSTLNQVVRTYVRSTESIVADIETSAIVVRHSGRGLFSYDLGGALLTQNIVEVPWQIADASYIKVGDKIGLVDMENEWHDRTIIEFHRVGTTDVCLAVMDRDYPPSCVPVKVLPPNYADYINLTGQPVLLTNKNRRAFIGEVGTYNSGNKTTTIVASSESELSGYFEQPVSGDAGCPVALVMDDALVWLGHIASTTSFSFWPEQYEEITDALASIDPAQKLRVQEFPRSQAAMRSEAPAFPVTTSSRYVMGSDSFDRADTADGGVGNGWVDSTTSWSISGNAIQGSTQGYNTDFLERPEILVEPRVTAIVEYKGSGGVGQSAAIWVRTNGANGYAGWLTNASGVKQLAIGKFIAGTPDTPVTMSIPSLAVGSFYALTVQAIGSKIIVDVATAAAPTVSLGRLTLTDTDYTSGKVMITPLEIGGKVSSITIEELRTAPLMAMDGNSLIAGYGIAASGSLPAQMKALLGGGWTIQSFGVSAQTTRDMLADVVTQIHPLFKASRIRNILLPWELTNDLFFGASPENALSAYKSYCSMGMEAGAQVIAMPVLPRGEIATPPGFEAARLVVNEELLNPDNIGVYWHGVCDFTGDSRLSDFNNTTYFLDKTHLTAAGYAVVAEKLREVVLAL